jgi:hypothetical protein
MNPWPFVIAAYGITLASAAALAIWAWLRMRDAEKK